MSRRFAKLRFWSNKKKCQACKGQPTPPPCYDCTMKVETPPPAFTSLTEHSFYEDDDASALCTYEEEYTSPEGAVGMQPYYHQEEDEEPHYGAHGTTDEGLEYWNEYLVLTEAPDFQLETTSHVQDEDRSFSFGDQTAPSGNNFLNVDNSGRSRHYSSPVYSNQASLQHPHLTDLRRQTSMQQLNQQAIINLEDDRSTITGSNRSLMDALTFPTTLWNDTESPCQLLPPFPREPSPLPHQLFIPE